MRVQMPAIIASLAIIVITFIFLVSKQFYYLFEFYIYVSVGFLIGRYFKGDKDD